MLLVDLGESRDTVAQAVKQRRYTAPVLFDSDMRVSERYGVVGTPTAVVIGRDGVLLGQALGPARWAEREGRALLQALLNSDPRSVR